MSKLQTGRRDRRAATVALIAVLGMVLAACGHNDDRPPPATGGSTPPPPTVTADSFVSYVQDQITRSSDTEEALSTEGVIVTAPETSEPVPLPST